MFEIKDKNKTIYFSNKKDADNYNDYLKNGLKVIKVINRCYYFNNGYVLIDVSITKEKKYVLRNMENKNVKIQRKYIEAIQ